MVAIGAAVQGAVLAGDVKGVLLLDVTPLSLGIETLGGVFTRLIDRNTTIPAKKSQTFSTAADGQTAVTIKVYQGEREMAADNKVLGNFDLTGIPSAARGIPQIEVTFDIDANGIVSVQAKDKASGKEQQIQIAANGGLSDADIKKMVTEAELNAGSDKKRRAFVESKNQCESLVEQLDRLLRDQESALSAPDKAASEQTISAARAAMVGTDHEKLLQAIEQLEHASARLQEAAQKPQDSGTEQPGAVPPKDHDAVDAEFEDVSHHG